MYKVCRLLVTLIPFNLMSIISEWSIINLHIVWLEVEGFLALSSSDSLTASFNLKFIVVDSLSVCGLLLQGVVFVTLGSVGIMGDFGFGQYSSLSLVLQLMVCGRRVVSSSSV